MKKSQQISFKPQSDVMSMRRNILNTPFFIEMSEGQIVMRGRLFTPDADLLPERLDLILREMCTVLKRRPVQVTFDLSYVCTRSRGVLLRFLVQLKELSPYSGYITGLKVRWCCAGDDDDMLELGEIYQELSGIDMVFCPSQWVLNKYQEY